MATSINPGAMIRAALMERDPRILFDLSQLLSTREGMVDVREQIRGLTIEAGDYEVLWDWVWHNDPAIAERVRTVVLLLRNRQLDMDLFGRLARSESSEALFEIAYNSSEQEFLVSLPGVPGWGISHYGRDDPEVDALLELLEKLYARANPGNHPPFFRQ